MNCSCNKPWKNPDFISVTEVLPKTNTGITFLSVLFQSDGYNAFLSTDGVRGVIIYTKSDLRVSPNDHLNTVYGDASCCDWVTDIKTGLLGSKYISPSSNNS